MEFSKQGLEKIVPRHNKCLSYLKDYVEKWRDSRTMKPELFLQCKVQKQWLSFAGDCTPVRRYLASRNFGSSWAPLKFLDALFRGYGQVVLADNPISGVLIFIALTVANPLVSGAGLLTASVGLLVSIAVIPQSSEVLGQGLTVFNSLLIGLITAGALPTRYGLDIETWHWFAMVIASVMSVYVESALGNVLGSLCRFPLPYLTVPFNIVQPLLFLTVISMNTHNRSDTLSVTALHMTSQPPSLIPSSLISVDRYNPLLESTPQSPLLLQLKAVKEMTPAGASLYGFTTHWNTFTGEISEDKSRQAHILNIQHTTVKPDENLEIQNTFQYGESMSNNTLQQTTESDRGLHLRENSTRTVHETEGGQSLTIAADVYQQKETPVTAMAPEGKHSAPSESASKTNNSHLQQNSKERNSSYSADNAMGLPRGIPNYESEGEAYAAGSTFSIAPSNVDLTTPETSQLHSTSIASDFNEENMSPDEGPATARVKRSNSLEAAQQNSLPLHQNASFDVMEPLVDWGGVFSGVVLSMSQVFGISYAPAAILIYLAVLIYSPIMAAFGVLGATTATITGLLLTDADTYATTGGVYDGTWGFNGLLSAMCLGGLFFVVNWPATLAAVLGSFLSTIILNILIPVFAQAELFPLSWPFNLSTLLFLCVTSSAIVRPRAISFPEKHLQDYKRLLFQRAQEHSASTSDIIDKDEETERVLSEVKVV